MRQSNSMQKNGLDNPPPVMGALFGNVMEFYDFTIYAFLAPQIGANFFPTGNMLVSILLTFAVFASGYLLRPLGALYFGHIGDKYGRKKALLTSISLITTVTFMIGLLPPYSVVGIIAPILLLICRMIQGFCVSGEEGGAVIFITEFNHQKLGISGALVLASVYAGVLLGSVSTTGVLYYFSNDSVVTWAWRIPFILSIGLGLISLMLRYRAPETPAFVKAKKNKLTTDKPVAEFFKRHMNVLVLTTFIVAPFCLLTSYLIVLLPQHLMIHYHFKQSLVMFCNTVAIFMLALITPLFGKLCDRFGYYQVFRAGLVFSAIFLPLSLVTTAGNTYLITLTLGSAFCLAWVSAPIFAMLITYFDIDIRFTAISFIFNVAVTLFSSITPTLTLSLFEHYRNNHLVALYMITIFTAAFFASLKLQQKLFKSEIRSVTYARI